MQNFIIFKLTSSLFGLLESQIQSDSIGINYCKDNKDFYILFVKMFVRNILNSHVPVRSISPCYSARV